MTDKMWKSVQKDCVQYVSSPQILLQSLIRGSGKIRYEVCWQEAHQKYPELLTEAYRNSDVTPIYIRAMQGHSGKQQLNIRRMSAWEVTTAHTWLLWHAGYRHNIDSVLRNGLIAGGPTAKPGRRGHRYLSICDPREPARGDPSAHVKRARGDPSEYE